MQAYQSILPPQNLRDVIDQIALIHDDVFKQIVKLCATERSFNPTQYEIREISSDSGIPENDIRVILGTLRFIYDRLKDLQTSDEDRNSLLELFLTEIDVDSEFNEGEFSALLNRLSVLLSRSDAHDNVRKRTRLERGLFPNAMKFKTYVDVRPDFNEDATRIKGHIQIVTFSIETDSIVPDRKNIRFQVPTDRLTDLAECISRLEKKLKLAEIKE